MRLNNPYTLALLLNEGKFSCCKAAKSLGFTSHDALTRQLVHGWEYQAIPDWSTLPKGGALIIDETTIAKPYSTELSQVHWVYDSTEGRAILGYKKLLVILVVAGRSYILRVCLPGTEKSNELFRQTLQELADAGLEPEQVLFDSWYAASETLNLIHTLGWNYATRIKSNRLFNGKAVNTHKFFGARGKTGHLKGVNHRVQIVKDGDRYLLTNDMLPHTSASLAKVYQGRWQIETLFRDAKQVLHLEKCACRSVEAQMNHILACLEAYIYLRQAFPERSVEAAQQEFLRRYRALENKASLIQAIAA